MQFRVPDPGMCGVVGGGLGRQELNRCDPIGFESLSKECRLYLKGNGNDFLKSLRLCAEWTREKQGKETI